MERIGPCSKLAAIVVGDPRNESARVTSCVILDIIVVYIKRKCYPNFWPRDDAVLL